MLVLVSFGLVLLATILLVVGLLNDDGLTLIYFSIAASATAAVVLYLAFRMARPDGGPRRDAPGPLADDLTTVIDDTTAPRPEEEPAAPPAAASPPPPPEAAAVPEPEPVASADDAWADDADWEVDDLEFPIADYDDLSVAEIMPLLPQLYSDELDIVYEREASSKRRSTILARLDKLKETGTEADAAEAMADIDGADADEADIEIADDPTQTIVAPAPAAEPAPRPEPSPAPSLSILDDEDDGAYFPIADYDDLSVSQIVPLLAQLEDDELEDVRAREQAGANRASLVAEIDRHLAGEGAAWAEESAHEPDHEEPAVAPAPPQPAPTSERDRLPIADYDSLTVADIRPQLSDLTDVQLEQVLEYERARDNRRSIVSDITRRLESAAPAPQAPKRAAPKKAAPRKATARRDAPKRAAKKAASKRTAKSSKKARATKKKAAANRFPIANYDELTVADIRPRLANLSAAQLRRVREREETGAGRKSILKEIDNRLS